MSELQVIGAGLPRTGTASLHAALTILGFGPCHHGSTLLRTPNRSLQYIHTLGKPTAAYRTLMHGYRSTVDMPNCYLVPELLSAFPEAKVVLSLRDSSDVWWKSFESSIGRMETFSYLLVTLPFGSLRHLIMMLKLGKYRMFRLFGRMRLDRAAYDRHNAWVRSIVPPGKLLEFNVKEGWAPLCKFLEVPVPDIPFPHANDTAATNPHIKKAIVIGLVSWMAIFICLGGIWYWSRVGGWE
ncbi:NAD dependent epimerase/dehydratase [Calocera cornea HHB12733]|uniref:NAD dependent epimerase/dehydratase n=1 Tax=Calocera cornea HHB12733 TaxID=1353952 RepID=A0A165CY91_9BASI|nr:NAD dependent epimerase/dehydratase [Calocera cornea HHB12733]